MQALLEGESGETIIRDLEQKARNAKAYEKYKPYFVAAAVACAKAVLPKVQKRHQRRCLAAIAAAEAWLSDPSEENRVKAEKAGDEADKATSRWLFAEDAARIVAYVVAGYYSAGVAAYTAYKADPTIDFPARIAAAWAELLAPPRT